MDSSIKSNHSSDVEWLNYHHLLYFWTVAREGSLGGASRKLNVSQPSISAQVAALERAVGAPLFQRSGRTRVLTEMGQMVLGYADEIFALGQELLSSVKGRGGRALRLQVGVVDSFPKLVANQILRPVFRMAQPIRVVCREGQVEELLPLLAVHRLDVVLSNRPVAGDLKVRTFNHSLGNSSVSIAAVPSLARVLRKDFPKSLDGVPAFLPTAYTPLREVLDKWFMAVRITPRIVAEFEDLALMKAVAADGKGFTALPTVALAEGRGQYGFESLGLAGEAREYFYAITAERRITHPAVAEITRLANAKMTR